MYEWEMFTVNKLSRVSISSPELILFDLETRSLVSFSHDHSMEARLDFEKLMNSQNFSAKQILELNLYSLFRIK